MGRPKSAVRRVKKWLALPEQLAARMELALISDLDGKVPQGAQQEFYEQAIKEKLDKMDAARQLAGMQATSPQEGST